MTAEVAGREPAFHGEGPVWDARVGVIRWVDMLAGDILTTEPISGDTRRLHVGEIAAAVRPRRRGGLVIALERGFALVDSDEDRVSPLGELWSDQTIRMNDGGCDPQGRFFCGSMARDETPGKGTVHRLDPDGSVTKVLTGVTVSNGLAWRPDGARAYYVDTPTQRIDQFDFDPSTGTFHGRHPLVNIPITAGKPDGLTIDAEGGLWLALWGGGAVHRYTADGQLDAVVRMPVTNVTACAFGGKGLEDLYVTTSRLQAPDSESRTAGWLYRVRPGVRGMPPLDFAG